jgi:hypothetical protein
MASSRRWKWLLVVVPFALILLFAGYEGIRVWWYRGYSTGSRSGVVRKLSVKGPPYCKYLSGELSVQATNTLAPENWEFSVDDDADTNPIVVALHDAEKKGTRVTLDYRQDLHALFRCSESEYFITKVEK